MRQADQENIVVADFNTLCNYYMNLMSNTTHWTAELTVCVFIIPYVFTTLNYSNKSDEWKDTLNCWTYCVIFLIHSVFTSLNYTIEPNIR